MPSWVKILAYRPEHPKWNQTLQFLQLSETTRIPVMIFQLESPEFPRGVTGGGGGGGGVCGMHDRPLKKGKFFQVEAGHIFVLEYTEGE